MASQRIPKDSLLAERIKMLRHSMELSTEQFGLLFAVSRRTVENWEQGRRQPRGLVLRALEKEFAKRA